MMWAAISVVCAVVAAALVNAIRTIDEQRPKGHPYKSGIQNGLGMIITNWGPMLFCH